MREIEVSIPLDTVGLGTKQKELGTRGRGRWSGYFVESCMNMASTGVVLLGLLSMAMGNVRGTDTCEWTVQV
jgi:hypothetical protein